jgi:predicted transcriptional regulator of viral defense system
MKESKFSYVGINLLRHLVGQVGLNIFSLEQARKAAIELNIKSSYVVELLHYLQKEGWIWRLKRGLYALNSESGLGPAPHEFEIAMALVTPSAISHWTALHYHQLSQQIPNKVFAITPTGTSIPRTIIKMQYHYIQVKPEHYFGLEKVWLENSQIHITDKERTLIDGLIAPQYCGDFQEILYAFQISKERINLEKIIDYALRHEDAASKRLGWVLEKLGYRDTQLDRLLIKPIKGYRKLDPSIPSKGPYNAKWKLQENIGE